MLKYLAYSGFGISEFVVLALFLLIFSLFVAPTIIGLWKVFNKAGKPGWACIVPLYNIIVLLEITGKPTWWILLMFIPFVNIVIHIIVYHQLSLSFGKDSGFTVGLIFLPMIFIPILGFGNSVYQPQSNI